MPTNNNAGLVCFGGLALLDKAQRRGLQSGLSATAGGPPEAGLSRACHRSVTCPHLPTPRRDNATSQLDPSLEAIREATKRPLTREEVKLLADALRNHEPWLEWAGKREKKGFEVEPVALHIHERISAQAILRVAARQDAQRDLFADPHTKYHQLAQFTHCRADGPNPF